MRPANVAQMLGVSAKTITAWTDHPTLSPFFSADTGSDNSRQREYTEHDVFVLNTIRIERARNTSWEDIAKMLRNGVLDRDLPASSLLVKSTVPVAQYERFIALTNERDAALKEVDRLSQELRQRDEAMERMRHERDETLDMIRRENNILLDSLRNEVRQLNREIGRLEGRLESFQEDENDRRSSGS